MAARGGAPRWRAAGGRWSRPPIETSCCRQPQTRSCPSSFVSNQVGLGLSLSSPAHKQTSYTNLVEITPSRTINRFQSPISRSTGRSGCLIESWSLVEHAGPIRSINRDQSRDLKTLVLMNNQFVVVEYFLICACIFKPGIKLGNLLLLTLLIVLAIRLLFSCCVKFCLFWHWQTYCSASCIRAGGLEPDDSMQILALRYVEGKKARDILEVYLIDENRHHLTEPFMDMSSLIALYEIPAERLSMQCTHQIVPLISTVLKSRAQNTGTLLCRQAPTS